MTHADRQRIYKVAIWLTKVMPVAISLVYVANTLCAFFGKDVPLFSWVAAMSLLPLIMFYVLSYALNMCSWHRALLHYIAVTEAINQFDYHVGIPVDTYTMLSIHLFITILFAILVINRFVKRENEEVPDDGGSPCDENCCGQDRCR